MLLEGERDAQLLEVCNAKTKELESKISVMETKSFVIGLQVKQLATENERIVKLNNSLYKTANRRKTFGIVMTSIAITLGVIVAIK